MKMMRSGIAGSAVQACRVRVQPVMLPEVKPDAKEAAYPTMRLDGRSLASFLNFFTTISRFSFDM